MDEETSGIHELLNNKQDEDVKYRWSLNYLKNQFTWFEDLYKEYMSRLQQGYFSLYLILQFLLSTSFSLVIFFESDKSLSKTSPDVYIYSVTAIISLIFLFLIRENHLPIASLVAYLIIYTIDTFLPVYHLLQHDQNMRTPFTTHLIIATYILFSFDKLFVALVGGGIITSTHLIICATVTFRADQTTTMIRKLMIELIFLLCINGLGCYFRYMNEIMCRRSFLVKKDEIKAKILCEENERQQKKLLEAILPVDMAEKMNMHFKNRRETRSDKIYDPHFFKQLVQTHKNVTILYADIVNYTQMTTRIHPASQLIEVLNDLFGGFDNDSEELNVMRIKFLGDCYYCVSGMQPNRNENHADACVQLGILMIARIKDVAKEHKIDLNMRIGIHTGDIYSALIGRTKWQFEIFSKDVQLANAMESAGIPGKVHITQETMDELLHENVLERVDSSGWLMRHCLGGYYVYKTNLVQKNKKLGEATKMTYVVTPIKMDGVDVYDYNEPQSRCKSHTSGSKSSRSTPVLSKISIDGLKFTRSVSSSKQVKKGKISSANAISMADYNHYENYTTAVLRKSIKDMPLTKYEQWFNEKEINPFLLIYKNCKMEKDYILQQDHFYKYYITSVLILLIGLIAIRYIAIPHWEKTTLLSIVTALCLLPLAPLLLLPEPAKRREVTQEDIKKMAFFKRLPYIMPVRYYDISHKFVKSSVLRTVLYVGICGICTTCCVIGLITCNYKEFQQVETWITLEENKECLRAWNITEIINLTLIMSFLFLKIHVWLKFLYGFFITVGYSYWVWYHSYDYYNIQDSFHYKMRPPVAHIINVIYLTITLHFIDRQADYLSRLDFKWHQQLAAEKAKKSESYYATLSLLENVMPYFVAIKYLGRDDSKSTDKPDKKSYYEKYKTVAVMFATLVDLEEEESRDDDENLFMMMLNEIISDFDCILMTEKFKRKVEKIKLANLKTYVAVAGLMPGKGFGNEGGPQEDAETGVRFKFKMPYDENLINLLNFAVEMRKALEKHNGECNRKFALRIGLCDGKLTAGVVGTKKPHYDIWGDCVNVASRMDTNGEPGQIQVHESTNMVLKRNGIRSRYNKYQQIKGKNYLHLFYVDLDENGNYIKDETIIEEIEEESEDDLHD